MIPLQQPMLSGTLTEQVKQLQDWGATLVSQLQMCMGNITEDDLSEAVRQKLNNPSQESKNAVEEINRYIEKFSAGQ